MAQHDMNLADQAGAAFRADLNDALAALVSMSSGATAPATTFAYQWWADTTAGKLKIRNAANDGWVEVGSLASANLGLQAYDADTMKSDVETDITGAMTHTPSSLTDGASIGWNLDTQQNATVTLGGNRVMNAPTNAKAGRYVGLRVVQDGTGGRTLTFNAAYKGMTGITPVTTANAVNFYLFRCIDTTNLALVGFRSNCES